MITSNDRRSLSLLQALCAIFITITLLVVTLSVTSVRGIERIGTQFAALSDNALPLAMTNAKLTQTILEHVKQLSYGSQSTTLESLSETEVQITKLVEVSQLLAADVMQLSEQFSLAITRQQLEDLERNIQTLSNKTTHILTTQQRLWGMQEHIDA